MTKTNEKCWDLHLLANLTIQIWFFTRTIKTDEGLTKPRAQYFEVTTIFSFWRNLLMKDENVSLWGQCDVMITLNLFGISIIFNAPLVIIPSFISKWIDKYKNRKWKDTECSEKKGLRSNACQILKIYTVDKSFGTTSFLPSISTLTKGIYLGCPTSRFFYRS